MGLGGLIQSGRAESASSGSSRLDLKSDCGAAGDGLSDDSKPLSSCLSRLQDELNKGRPATLLIPSGIYLISGNSGPMPTIRGRGGAIVGDGPHQSYIKLDKSYGGDLFSWSEAWIGNNFGPSSYDIFKDASGPTIVGIQITGTIDSKSPQNGIAFYDRNDHVLVRDVEISYLAGRCLSFGQVRYAVVAFTRESSFFNVKCWKTGARTSSAVEISSVTAEHSDATNELDFYKLAVLGSGGSGIAVRNPNKFSATRRLRFFGIRIENVDGDGLTFGEQSDNGQIAEIAMFDLTIVQAKGAAIRFTGSAQAPAPYQISIVGGSLGPGNRVGISIEKGRELDIDLAYVDAPIVMGEGAGDDIRITGSGVEHDWKFEAPQRNDHAANPLNLRTPFDLRGLPGSVDRVGVSALKATASSSAPVYLTMDGRAPAKTNCFSPATGKIYNVYISLIARDRMAAGSWFAWSIPGGVLANANDQGGLIWTPIATPISAQHSADGANAAAGVDKPRDCLAITFTRPYGNTHVWDVTARLDYASVP
jgi:hypothetical protein